MCPPVLSCLRMQRIMRFLGIWMAVWFLQACSVAPVPDPKVPGVATRQMVFQRACAVVVTSRKDLSQWVNRGFSISHAPGDADGGSGTPLTADGYFLTADHVLARMADRNVFVLYGKDHGLVPVKARVVWRSEQADLAILHIPAKTPFYYSWSPPDHWLPAGTALIHGGIATGFRSDWGKLSTSIPPESPFSGTRRFKIDIPLQPGDSGGPVVDAYGALVGINSAVEFLVPMETAFFVDSEANRPNTAMIATLIRKDRARYGRGKTNVE